MPQSVSFDPIADRYDDTRGHPADVTTNIARELMRLGALQPGADMLEPGIGTGRIALPLLAAGVNVTGVDISPRMLERLRAKYASLRAAEPERAWGRLTVEQADVTTLPFDTGRFDAAVMVHVLHLIPDWRRALDEILRVLKPGGVLLLGQDTRAGDDEQIEIQDQWQALIGRLGFQPTRAGAASYASIVDEIRQRGLRADEFVVATWETQRTPREILRYITEREWSLTWGVPDKLFAASADELNAWAEQRFKGALDKPLRLPSMFKVTRVQVPQTV